MKKSKRIYTFGHKVSAIFMILALLWLTVSTPFVFACQQEMAKQGKLSKAQAAGTTSEEEAAKTVNNTTEEKVPSGNSFSEEYLHEQHTTHYFIFKVQQHHTGENADDYVAYHGELLVPPPNVS
jgi:hypothetical protein